MRNKNLYHNDITKVISGSHALAKRCGDWCQAIQTKREFKKAIDFYSKRDRRFGSTKAS